MSNFRLLVILANSEFQILDIYLDGNGIIEPHDLKSIIMPEIDSTKGVVINGRAPIWLFSYLTHQCHTASWVATFDPRLGAVVVEAHHPSAPAIGDVISIDRIKPYIPLHANVPKEKSKSELSASRVIAFLGPPHSGKSVLMNALSVALGDKMNPADYHKGFFILRACPDGEGNWAYETPQEFVKTLRYKNSFDDSFVDSACNQLRELRHQKSVLFVDCGGRIDRKNQQILNLCTHAIIVSSDASKFDEWRGAATASEVKVLALVKSSLDPVCEVKEGDPLAITFGKLERSQSSPQLPEALIDAVLNRS